jgi:hypothetical protein
VGVFFFYFSSYQLYQEEQTKMIVGMEDANKNKSEVSTNHFHHFCSNMAFRQAAVAFSILILLSLTHAQEFLLDYKVSLEKS